MCCVCGVVHLSLIAEDITDSLDRSCWETESCLAVLEILWDGTCVCKSLPHLSHSHHKIWYSVQSTKILSIHVVLSYCHFFPRRSQYSQNPVFKHFPSVTYVSPVKCTWSQFVYFIITYYFLLRVSADMPLLERTNYKRKREREH